MAAGSKDDLEMILSYILHHLLASELIPLPPPQVSQFRPPVGKEVLELPAGLVDDGEVGILEDNDSLMGFE